MLLGSRQHREINQSLDLKCGQDDIEEVNSFKYLGVMLDKFLNFDVHAEYISKKISQRLASLARSRKFMTPATSLQLYKSLIVSLFDYCDTVYLGMSQRDLNHLQILQNKACRVILKRGRFSNSLELHHELHIPLLSQRRELHLLVMVHKSLKKKHQATFRTSFH